MLSLVRTGGRASNMEGGFANSRHRRQRSLMWVERKKWERKELRWGETKLREDHTQGGGGMRMRVGGATDALPRRSRPQVTVGKKKDSFLRGLVPGRSITLSIYICARLISDSVKYFIHIHCILIVSILYFHFNSSQIPSLCSSSQNRTFLPISKWKRLWYPYFTQLDWGPEKSGDYRQIVANNDILTQHPS